MWYAIQKTLGICDANLMPAAVHTYLSFSVEISQLDHTLNRHSVRR